MGGTAKRAVAALLIASISTWWPARAGSETLTLDAASVSLPAIPATDADLLTASAPPAAPPPPVLAIPAGELGLLPGDVIDAVGDGPGASLGGTLYFSVTRTAAGIAGPVPPDVASEQTVPPTVEAAGDVFSTFDPACPATFGGFNTQVLDGDGAAKGPAPACYPGLGLGLAEVAAPPVVDNLNSFDWSWPGRARLGCLAISLAPGSPTLTGANPLLPGSHSAADVIFTCPAYPPLVPDLFIPVTTSAAALGLVAGDDIDAVSVVSYGSRVAYSLAPGSPTLITFGLSPADVLGGTPPMLPPPPVLAPAAALGLLSTDDVDALEFATNPLPVAPLGDADGDGIGMAADNCPLTFNPGQEDSDGDAVGDSCDPCTDSDGDGFGNPGFPNACPLDNCPTVTNTLQTDGDGDGMGEGCDDCTNVAGARNFTGKRRIVLRHINTNTVAGDDTLVIRGVFNTGVPYDLLYPLSEGVRIRIRNAAGVTKVDLFVLPGFFLPGGMGWYATGTATRWRYHAAPAAAVNGIRRVTIRRLPGGNVRVVVKGVNGTYPIVAGDLPLRVSFALGNQFTADNGGCGETVPAPLCALNAAGDTVRCGP